MSLLHNTAEDFKSLRNFNKEHGYVATKLSWACIAVGFLVGLLI